MELWTQKSYHAAFSEKHLIGSSFILGHDYDPKHTECGENIPGYKKPIDLNGIETLLCVNFVFTLAYCISVYYCMFLVNRCFKKRIIYLSMHAQLRISRRFKGRKENEAFSNVFNHEPL